MRMIDADKYKEDLWVGHEYLDEDTLLTATNILDSQPTIEAEAVRHGRWAYIGGDEWCCTNCGEVISTEGRWERPTYNYCHECGAKMDGDSHDTEG